MHLFFLAKIAENKAFLDEDDARHCIKVLRKKPGEPIDGVDGEGNYYRGIIESLGKDLLVMRIEEKIAGWGENDKEIICGISLLHKVDRFEWFIEKSVELGVTCIRPFISDRTVKLNIRPERIQKILISALKQCKRSRTPEFQAPVPFEDLVQEFKTESIPKLIPFCNAEKKLGSMESEIRKSQKVLFLIGPEGDFTQEEIDSATACGFKPVSLGTTIMRTETAALHMLSVIRYLQS